MNQKTFINACKINSVLKDSKAVSPVIGFILLLQILIIFLAFIQTNVVPDQMKKIEADNVRSVKGEIAKFSALVSAGSDAYLVVKTPEYPDYLFLLTPEPAGFSVMTEPFRINVSLNLSLPNGSKMEITKTYESRRLYVTVNNYFYPDTTFVFENTAVFQKSNGGYGTAGEQNMVKNGLNLVILRSNISESYNAPHEFSFKPVSSGGRYYAENMTLEFQSVNPDYWRNEGFNVSGNTVSIRIPSGSFSITVISDREINPNSEYMIKTNPFDSYTLSVGDFQEFGVLILDSYLNPVPGANVNASVSGRIGSITHLTQETDSSGVARISFRAESPGNGSVQFTSGNLTADYSVTVRSPQAGNASTLVQVSWLNTSGTWDVGASGSRKLLLVKVTDLQSTPIPGIEVRFSITNSSVLSLNATTALTDSDGIARVEASAMANGSVRVYAFAGDGGDIIEFNITNITWRYKRPVYIEERSGNDLTNYAVKITLDSTNFDFSKVKQDGSDIRFWDGSSYLNYWIEKWDSNLNQATVWVKIPSLPRYTNITIYMIYGNPAAVSMSSVENTFNVVGEAGKAVVGGTEKTVTLSRSFNNPVVLAAPVVQSGLYRSGDDTAQHHLITSVGNSSFNIKQVESFWGDYNIDSTEVNYIVLEEGEYYIGTNLLAEVSSMNARGSYRSISLNLPFSTTPATLADTQEPSLFLDTIYTRIRSPSSSGFSLQIESDDSSNPGSSIRAQTGYAAIQQGLDPVNKIEVEKTGRSISDSFRQITFSNLYASSPVVVAQLVSEYGPDQAYAVVRSVTQSSFELAVEEPASRDGPHTTEEFAWISVPSGLIYGREYVNPEPKVTLGPEL